MNQTVENINTLKIGRSILMRIRYGDLINDKGLLENHTVLTLDNWKITDVIEDGFLVMAVKNDISIRMHIDNSTYVFLMIEY